MRFPVTLEPIDNTQIGTPTLSTYECRLCGHAYGNTAPSAPAVQLHLTVSHSGSAPIIAIEV